MIFLDKNSPGCGQKHCGACCGGACSGCGGTLQLTQGEIDLLFRFAQIPFLPVARQAGSEQPVCLEEGEERWEELSPIISALSQKGLIRLDYDLPLSHFDYAEYLDFPLRGSMALTAAGQQAVDQLEIQGIEEESDA